MFRFRFWMAVACSAVIGLAGLAGSASAQDQLKSATIDKIKQRGELICGVDTGIPGYAFQDSKGEWQGLDISFCRAIADALLGSPNKVKYIGTTSKVRFSSCSRPRSDVLIGTPN